MRATIPINPLQLSPIGYLRGFETDDITDIDMIKRDLEPLGLEVRFLVQSVKAEHGCRGGLLSFAVTASNWEEAQKLPGFVPLGHWSGAFFIPPKLDFDWRTPDDEFEGRAIKRINVTDAYGEEFEPPRYKDGVFVMSMIPQGYLAQALFFEDDPLHVYAIPRCEESEDKMIEWVRRFRSSL